MGSILNTAISGINSMKIMIENTVNKINHPIIEQNREKRSYAEHTGQDSDANTITKVKEIYNNYNDFILEEKRKTSERVKDEETKIEQLSKLEDLLRSKSNVFDTLINNLYPYINNHISFNSNNTVNEQLKQQLDTVIFQLKDFNNQLQVLEKDLKEAVISNIEKANNLIDEIYDLTVTIRYFPIVKHFNTKEELIEKREDLVDQLNDLIGIQVIKNDDSYKLCLNNGICVVDDNEKQNLVPLTSNEDERYISVGYIDNDHNILRKIENMIPSATIGALLKFRKEELTDAKNKIGQLTVNFANSINLHPVLGYEMFERLGKQVFYIANPEVISSPTNHSSTIIESKWTCISDAKDTDYIIYFKDNNWTVKRLSDNSTVETNIYPADNNRLIINFDGIKFIIQGDNVDGDIYMIKPYSQTLEQLNLFTDNNNPFGLLSMNKNNAQNPIDQFEFNQNFLVDHKDTIDQSYEKFFKSISDKCNTLEEEIPFKKNMIEILRTKKSVMPDDIEKNYNDLNYEQECYLANVKILQIAESIFNEIVDCYS